MLLYGIVVYIKAQIDEVALQVDSYTEKHTEGDGYDECNEGRCTAACCICHSVSAFAESGNGDSMLDDWSLEPIGHIDQEAGFASATLATHCGRHPAQHRDELKSHAVALKYVDFDPKQ